jgi:hypothetical protein
MKMTMIIFSLSPILWLFSCSPVVTYSKYGIETRLVTQDGGIASTPVSVTSDGSTRIFRTDRNGHLKVPSVSNVQLSWLGGVSRTNRLEQHYRIHVDGYKNIEIYYNKTMPDKSSSFNGSRVTAKDGLLLVEKIFLRVCP